MTQGTVQRRQTYCSSCKEEFALGYPLVAGQDERNLIINTSCPYCQSKLTIHLRDFLKPRIEGYKGTRDAGQADTTAPEIDAGTPLIIPEGTVLPSELRTKDEDDDGDEDTGIEA